MELFYQYLYQYPILSVLQTLLTLWMVIDCYQRGAEWFWFWIILLVQPIGAWAYFLAVKLPDFALDGKRRRVDVLLGGTNLHLRRSPLYVEGPSVRWQKRPQA